MTLVDVWVLGHIWTLIKGSIQMPDLCSGWSIPLNKPVFTMTTVVQKQTSSLHVYKIHLFFISYVFDLYRHCYRTSTFFWGTFALTFCHWHLDIKYCFGKTLLCLFFLFFWRVVAGSGFERLTEEDRSSCVVIKKWKNFTSSSLAVSLTGFF